MKIITLWQPWATLIALGYKKYETRHRGTKYRGRLAIHAAKRPVKDKELAAISYDSIGHINWEKIKNIEYPLGAIVAVSNLVDCHIMTNSMRLTHESCIAINSITPLEKSMGFWEPGRFAWELDEVKKIEPIPCRGSQGLWNLPQEIAKAIGEQPWT